MSIDGFDFESDQLSRRVFIRLSGLDAIPVPGLQVPRFERFLVNWGYDGLLKPFPGVIEEYERRWRIERAATQIKTYRQVIKREKALGPYVDD